MSFNFSVFSTKRQRISEKKQHKPCPYQRFKLFKNTISPKNALVNYYFFTNLQRFKAIKVILYKIT